VSDYKAGLKDYVEVADRLAEAFEKWPEGSMQGEAVFLENPCGWLVSARFYRTPDDARPGVGHAFEPVPGKTPYTKDSECMNAETSAWGRALVAVGLKTKHIASANELRARGANGKAAKASGAAPGGSKDSAAPDDIEFAPELPAIAESFPTPGDGITDKQLKFLKMLATKLVKASDDENKAVTEFKAELDATYGVTATKDLTKTQAGEVITLLKERAVAAGLIEE
jgi:hypothetical protein